MKPADVQKVFEGAFTSGRPGSLSQFVRADQFAQIWTNSLDPYWSDPNGKAATVLKDIQDQTDAASIQVESEMGK